MDVTPEAALLYLATHPGVTTSDVGKALFKPETDSELRNADRRVRYWFEEKYPDLITADADTAPTTYSVEDDRVFAGLGRIEVETFNDENLSIGLGGTVVYIDENGNPNVETVGDVVPEKGELPPEDAAH